LPPLESEENKVKRRSVVWSMYKKVAEESGRVYPKRAARLNEK
jgi:hypothetical protein